MNVKTCASSGMVSDWKAIDWKKAEAYVKKLQMRIVQAHKAGHYHKVQSLQWLLTHSFYAKALAVKRVTSNKGKKTPGVDHQLWMTPQAKLNAINCLKRHGYKPLPLRRIYIPKKNGKMRPLSIEGRNYTDGLFGSVPRRTRNNSSSTYRCFTLEMGVNLSAANSR